MKYINSLRIYTTVQCVLQNVKVVWIVYVDCGMAHISALQMWFEYCCSNVKSVPPTHPSPLSKVMPPLDIQSKCIHSSTCI